MIKDPRLHEQIVDKVTKGIEERGFKCLGVVESPIEGAMGNKEFLAFFEHFATTNSEFNPSSPMRLR